MRFEFQSYPDAKAAAEACADYIATRLEQAITGRGYATLAISGGTSPKPMFAKLADSSLPWDRIHVFWVDERAVPPTDSQSNYKLATETLLVPGHVPERNIHRVRAELEPEAAAHAYVREIREFFGLSAGELPEFDVIHRGMGPDAHTASLFPGEPLIDDRTQIAAAVYVQKMAQWRITLLPGVLMAAHQTVVLAAGEDKAEPLRSVFSEPTDWKKYPSQIAPDDPRSVLWFLDNAAARLLTMTA